jgi:hypothetical protein
MFEAGDFLEDDPEELDREDTVDADVDGDGALDIEKVDGDGAVEIDEVDGDGAANSSEVEYQEHSSLWGWS